MKRTYFLPLVITMMIVITGFNVNAAENEAINLQGDSNTKMGTYQIKEQPAENIEGKTLRKFELVYQNAKNPVTIYLDEKENCRDYIVRSKNMEIKYVCKKNGFGAQLLSGKYVKYDPKVNSYFIATDELTNQSRISEGGITPENALGLIASYYPSLLKSTDLL